MELSGNTMNFRLCMGLPLLLLAGCGTLRPGSDSGRAETAWTVEQTGKLEHRAMMEVSGVAPSQLRDDMLWMINDSGNSPRLYAVRTDGAPLGELRVLGAENFDWEDLESFRQEDQAWLIVADIGDNDAVRSTVRLLWVKEPDFRCPGHQPTAVPVSRILEFRYEDGPRDAEGLAVEVAKNRILIASKRTHPPDLYALPLDSGPGPVVAKKITPIPDLRPADLGVRLAAPSKAKYAHQPTALSFAPQSGELVLMTYQDLYLYPNWGENGDLSESRRIPLPRMKQAEACCFSQDETSIYVTSEQLPAPLYRMQRTLPPNADDSDKE